MHALALAYALSTLSGLRVSYPAAALSLAVHSGVVRPPEHFAWLHSDMTLTIALIASVVELIAHKCSWLETPTHYIHKFLSPLVGGAAASAVDPSQGLDGILPAALGAGNAFIVHALRSTARVTGNAFFLGGTGMFASFAEDALAVIAATAAFVAAQKTAWIVLIAMIGCWLLTYRPVPRRPRRHRARA